MSKPRVRRSKEEAQRLILDAAFELVSREGPDRLRLSDVAAEAGMHQTNVLHHFKSKDGLLKALAAREMDDGAGRALRALGEALGAPEDKRAEALTNVFRVIQTRGVGRLYGWLMLSGLISEDEHPDLTPLVRGLAGLRAVLLPKGAPADDDELRMIAYFGYIVWLGEAIGGNVFAHAVGFDDPASVPERFHSWMSTFLERAIEAEAEGK